LDAANVHRLRVRWRFRVRNGGAEDGALTATPLVRDGHVYVQDMRSDVFALDARTGRVLWARRFGARSPGPNGLAADGGLLFGSTDTTVFALELEGGRTRWSRRILSPVEQYVDVAPVVANGLVYTSTVGYPPRGRGFLYALDERNGRVRWRFDTIRDPWRFPELAGGGGAWQPPSVDADGRVYVGTANPAPWGGSRRHPNGGMYPGPVPFTDSLLVLDGKRGSLLWHDQVTPHDIRDHDFQDSPVLAGRLVIGAGKAGRVIAWDRQTHRRVWETQVGVHENDSGPLSRSPERVCPGLLGGVETPMAYANGRLFVPVVDLCYRESAVAPTPLMQVDPSNGRGALVALDAHTGHVLWTFRLGSPDFGCATVARDVVFTGTYDGRVFAFAARTGRLLWTARVRSGINACPAVGGGMLVVAAGAPNPHVPHRVPEVVAFSLR
jgi:outer membrane protein assembly factor BamB